MADKYILADRTSGSIFALQINDGQLELAVDTGTPQAEPILKDTANSTRWTLFIDNFQLGIETVASTSEVTLSLEDIDTGHVFNVQIENGQLKITESYTPVFETATIVKKKHYAGEIGANLILDTDIDILAATLTQINVKKPDGTETVWAGTVYQTTKIKHEIEEGDIDLPGNYQMQAYIETASTKIYGETVELYVYDLFD